MPANITSVTVCFGNGIKREEYGPVKKAEVSLTAAVDGEEDGAVVLAFISTLAMARVAEMLSVPKPVIEQLSQELTAAPAVVAPAEDAPPPRRTRGPNKPKGEGNFARETAEPVVLPADTEAPAADEWSVGADDIVITDQEILSALSRRAADLGTREPCLLLVASFATRVGEGPPFKAQEIPQNQRKDFLTKLAALTA